MNNVKSIITSHNAHIARKNKPQDKGIVNRGIGSIKKFGGPGFEGHF
jgi:hypothetical protein